MAENNLQSGTNSRSSNSDWDENQNRYGRDYEGGQQQRSSYGQSSGMNRESDFDQSNESRRNWNRGNTGNTSSGYGQGSQGNYNSGNFGSGQGWGQQDYGNQNFGQSGYGSSGYGNQGYGHSYRGGSTNFEQSNYGNQGYGNQGWGEQGYEQDYNRGFGNQGYGNERRRSRNFGSQSGYGDSFNPTSGSYGSDYNRNWGSRSGNLGGASSGYGSDYNRGEYGRWSEGYGFNSPYYDANSSDRGWDDYSQRTSFGRRGRYGNEGYMGANYGRRSENDFNRDRGNDRDRNWWDRASDEVSSWFGDEDAERRRRQDRERDNRGRGPRGYQRSDERIKEDINDRLSDDSWVDATEVSVEVNRGEVVLSGTVDNRIEKRRAEDLAESISGVRNVENRIRVTDHTSYGDSMRSSGSGSSTSGSISTPSSASSASNTSTSSTERSKRP